MRPIKPMALGKTRSTRRNMGKLIDTFLPPGVQAKLWQRLGATPRVMPWDAHEKIMALWSRRNKCDEEEIDAIDTEMEEIAVAAANTPGVL